MEQSFDFKFLEWIIADFFFRLKFIDVFMHTFQMILGFFVDFF